MKGHGGGWCARDIFASDGTFSSTSYGDSGDWTNGGSTISMAWTAGGNTGLFFNGHFVSTTKPVEYKGTLTFGGALAAHAKLVKGAVAGC